MPGKIRTEKGLGFGLDENELYQSVCAINSERQQRSNKMMYFIFLLIGIFAATTASMVLFTS